MSGHFSITVDQRRGLLKIILGGFFSVGDVADYLEAKRTALSQLGCAPNHHLTLCDVSACDLQSQDVVHVFKQSLDDPQFMSRRIAFVVGSALARMQVRRILTRDHSACFDSTSEAEEWLLGDDQAAKAS